MRHPELLSAVLGQGQDTARITGFTLFALPAFRLPGLGLCSFPCRGHGPLPVLELVQARWLRWQAVRGPVAIISGTGKLISIIKWTYVIEFKLKLSLVVSSTLCPLWDPSAPFTSFCQLLERTGLGLQEALPELSLVALQCCTLALLQGPDSPSPPSLSL